MSAPRRKPRKHSRRVPEFDHVLAILMRSHDTVKGVAHQGCQWPQTPALPLMLQPVPVQVPVQTPTQMLPPVLLPEPVRRRGRKRAAIPSHPQSGNESQSQTQTQNQPIPLETVREYIRRQLAAHQLAAPQIPFDGVSREAQSMRSRRPQAHSQARVRADVIPVDLAQPQPQPKTRREEGGTCFVYLFVHLLGQRFKIGISEAPQTRLSQLPEAQHIDLEESLQVLMPNRQRALQVERALHRILGHYRIHKWQAHHRPPSCAQPHRRTKPRPCQLAAPSNPANTSNSMPSAKPAASAVTAKPGKALTRWDGSTEWFELSGFTHALELINVMPHEDAGHKTTALPVMRDLRGKPYVLKHTPGRRTLR